MARHCVDRLGRAVVYGGLQFGGRLRLLLLGSALSGSLAIERLHLSLASGRSAFTYLLPVVATILGIVWLGEKGSWGQVLGGVLALSGVYWIESGRAAVVKAIATP